MVVVDEDAGGGVIGLQEIMVEQSAVCGVPAQPTILGEQVVPDEEVTTQQSASAFFTSLKTNRYIKISITELKKILFLFIFIYI